jgi:hypothetical protein
MRSRVITSHRAAAFLAPDHAPGLSADPSRQLIEMAAALWKARAVYAAARLALADLIADGQRTAQELARTTGMHAPSLNRLLRALGSCGVLTEAEPGCFALTALGAALRTGAPGAARATVLTLAGDWQWKAWDNFLYSLRTGQPALLEAYGQGLFEYLAANPDDGARFNEAMIGMHGADGAAVAAAYDFSAIRNLVDLGGGTGALLAALLQSNPHLRGTLLELPETVPQARRLLEAMGVSERCDVQAGDFFKQVPADHDVYVLAHVLHDWTDEQATAILRKCRQAIPRHGRLLIIESVLPLGDTPHPGKMMDLLMLTITGGVERTAGEFAAVLAAAGFRLARVIPTSTHQSIVEAGPEPE